MLHAERARSLLGEGVAVALAVRSPDERGHDLEAPLRDVDGLAPEVGQAEVDVELEEVDACRASLHAIERRGGVGRTGGERR